MTDTFAYVAFLLFAALQAGTARRRRHLPLLQGDGYFFGIAVPPGFYATEGRRILRHHRRLLLIPYAVELMAAVAVLWLGHPTDLLKVILAMTVLIPLNHAWAVNVARKQVRPFAIPGSGETVTRVMLSLESRRLRDYTHSRFEWILGSLNALMLGWLTWQYVEATGPRDWKGMFGLPLVLVYLQLGMLLAKRAVIAWRTVVPRDNAQVYLDYREQTRRLFTDTFDSIRAIWVYFLVISTTWLSTGFPDSVTPVFILLLAGGGVWLLWYRRRRDEFLKVAGQTPPVRLPSSLEGMAETPPLLCYQPGRPVLLIKGARGYALNLASPRAQVGALYLAGLATVFLWLRQS